MGPRAGRDGCGNPLTNEIRSPDRPSSSESLSVTSHSEHTTTRCQQTLDYGKFRIVRDGRKCYFFFSTVTVLRWSVNMVAADLSPSVGGLSTAQQRDVQPFAGLGGPAVRQHENKMGCSILIDNIDIIDN